MPVFIVSVFTRHAILCLLQNNLCPAPHLHPRPGHKYYPGRKADLRPQDPSLRLLLFVPHNICRFYGFINGVLQCPTLVLSPIPKPCCQNKESYKTKKGRTMTVRAVTVGRNARFFQEHSPLTGHGMGKLCDAAFGTAPDEENAHPTKSRKAHVIEHFASLGLRLSTAERTEALHWCLTEVRVDDYARSGAVGQGRRRPCKRQPHQRFVRKRVREYCEQGIFCNFGLAGLGIGLSTPSTRDVSQGSPFVDCWPLFTANGWAGGERCMQEAARLGFDRTGVLPSLWFQPRAYRKALPSDSSKLQAGPPGRGCSRFYCSRCWTL
jgi:hypothetical protein